MIVNSPPINHNKHKLSLGEEDRNEPVNFLIFRWKMKEIGEFGNILLCIMSHFPQLYLSNIIRYLFSFYNSFGKNGFFVIFIL